MSIISWNVKDHFDQKFEEYKRSVEKMQGITTDGIKNALTENIKEHFSNLWSQIFSFKNAILEKIRVSSTVQELEEILDETRNFFEKNTYDIFKI